MSILKRENVFTREINRRLNAVAELCSPCGSCLSSLKGLLTQLPDVERGLCTIYHKKVSFTFVFPKCFLTGEVKSGSSTELPPSELFPNNLFSWLFWHIVQSLFCINTCRSAFVNKRVNLLPFCTKCGPRVLVQYVVID